MGEKDFQKFMMNLSRILGITGDMVVCFNRIPGDVIMISPKVTTPIDISYKHQNPDSLAVGEGISVNVGLLDDGTFEEILKNAYENNEFRFDYPEEVLEKLKPEGLGVSSKRLQEFIEELRETPNDRESQQPNTGGFKISAQQAHRVVGFFAPEVTLEEVQKLIEAIQLEEVRK